MFDAKTLAQSVQNNCHISDAQFAGNYTLCIFLLKMREYFRWEQGIPLSQPLPHTELGDWLVAREEAWDKLESAEFHPLTIDGQQFDPFDSDAINRHINDAGYVYSAGYGLYRKPCFFLARLHQKEHREGTVLYLSGEELARDLAAPPAMLQGRNVFIRRESLRRFIWEKMEELGYHKNAQTPMSRALACYAGRDLESTLDRMTENEVDTLILHEEGETMVQERLGDAWEELLLSLPRSRSEFLLRAARDNLADCLSTLPTLIERDNQAALHFYFANFTGMRKEIFPSALAAYHDWLDSGSTAPLLVVCESGGRHWLEVSQAILAAWHTGSEQNNHVLEADIEQRCRPL